MGVPVMLQNGTKTLNSTSRSHWKIQAVIPSQYTRETLPRPNSSKIKFINVPAHRCAVMRFSGLAGDRVVKKYTHQLLSCVENNKLKLRGDPVFCFYNYSWTLPFMRRNEVMVNLDAHGINASMSYKPVVHSTLSAPKLKKRTKMKTESAKKVKYAADGTIIVEHKTVEAMALSKSAGAKPKAKTAKKKVAKKASAVKAKAKKTTASKAKAAPKKVAAKKTVAKKTVAKKTTAKKAVAKKVTVKKVVAKKTKKVAAKKTTSAVKKSVAKKSMAKKPAVKKSVSKKKVASKSLTLSKALKSKKTLHKKAAPKAHKKIVAKKDKARFSYVFQKAS